MSRKIGILFCTIVCAWSLQAQDNDPILFSVENIDVPVSEFRYIYDKTNGDKASYSVASLKEYLDLYVKFKLKVKRAQEMKLDTIPALQRELDGYRRQLANSYLIDKEVTDRLVREAYDRMGEDINVSHIMIQCASDTSPADTALAYAKINKIMQQLKDGASFELLASTQSGDPSSRKNNGNIGYMTAMLPRGFYHFESAAYNTPAGEVSNIVRSGIGYHIIKVTERRPARGQMEVAHILIRNKKGAEQKADSLHNVLVNGGDFELMARMFSEDKLTAGKGGYLGFFGINTYEKTFEEAAFALRTDGEFTKPFKTASGLHIAKRIGKKNMLSFDEAERALQTRVSKDQRYELAKKAFVERIKQEVGIREFRHVLKTFYTGLNKDFLTYRWRPDDANDHEILLEIGGDHKVTLGEFKQACKKNSRVRARRGKDVDLKDVAYDLYHAFVDDSVLKYEEMKLPEKYSDFKNLMREYEEGILLFEATKITVWDRAGEDTLGLNKFYESHKEAYKTAEEAEVSIYTLKAAADSGQTKKLAGKIAKKAKKLNAEALLSEYGENSGALSVETGKFEKGKNIYMQNIKWAAGAVSQPMKNPEGDDYVFVKIDRLISPRIKALNEAKGYIIADYQDLLETKWVSELRHKYAVKVNQPVFDSLVRK